MSLDLSVGCRVRVRCGDEYVIKRRNPGEYCWFGETVSGSPLYQCWTDDGQWKYGSPNHPLNIVEVLPPRGDGEQSVPASVSASESTVSPSEPLSTESSPPVELPPTPMVEPDPSSPRYPVGSRVLVRDGREFEITEWAPGTEYPLKGFKVASPYGVMRTWTEEGVYLKGVGQHPLDIVSLAPSSAPPADSSSSGSSSLVKYVPGSVVRLRCGLLATIEGDRGVDQPLVGRVHDDPGNTYYWDADGTYETGKPSGYDIVLVKDMPEVDPCRCCDGSSMAPESVSLSSEESSSLPSRDPVTTPSLNLSVGCLVRLRNGDEYIVDAYYSGMTHCWGGRSVGCVPPRRAWTAKGRFAFLEGDHPYDIVSVVSRLGSSSPGPVIPESSPVVDDPIASEESSSRPLVEFGPDRYSVLWVDRGSGELRIFPWTLTDRERECVSRTLSMLGVEEICHSDYRGVLEE